jgi:hypothetical protein
MPFRPHEGPRSAGSAYRRRDPGRDANDLNDHVGWPPRRCGREQCHWSGESTLATAARSSFYGRLGAGGAEVRIIRLDGERLRALAGRRTS